VTFLRLVDPSTTADGSLLAERLRHGPTRALANIQCRPSAALRPLWSIDTLFDCLGGDGVLIEFRNGTLWLCDYSHDVLAEYLTGIIDEEIVELPGFDITGNGKVAIERALEWKP
jgi:hypothetical protein